MYEEEDKEKPTKKKTNRKKKEKNKKKERDIPIVLCALSLPQSLLSASRHNVWLVCNVTPSQIEIVNSH